MLVWWRCSIRTSRSSMTSRSSWRPMRFSLSSWACGLDITSPSQEDAWWQHYDVQHADGADDELGNQRSSSLPATVTFNCTGGWLGPIGPRTSTVTSPTRTRRCRLRGRIFKETETGLARYVRPHRAVRERMEVEEMDPLEFSMLE